MVNVLAGVLILLIGSGLSILFIPRVILARSNSIYKQSNEVLRTSAQDFKNAAEQIAASELKTRTELSAVQAKYIQTADAMAEQARRYRNEIGWLKEEFFRATNKYPAPMPADYTALIAVP